MTKNEAKRAFLDKGLITKETFNRFLDEDPTTQKKYVFYMIKEYIKQANESGISTSNITPNDLDMGILSPIFSYVTEYNTLLSRVPQDKKDIYKLSFDELIEIVESLNNSDSGENRRSLRKKAREGSDILLDNVDGVTVVAPYNHDAICYYGQSTRWCVSMDTPSHWMGYYFNQKNTFYIIIANSDEVKNKIRNHYSNKWKKMGFGKPHPQTKKTLWTLVKDGKDIANAATLTVSDAEEEFKSKLGLSSLNGYEIENYGYRNLFKTALLIPALKNRQGDVVRDEDGNPQPDYSRVQIYGSDDTSFNSGWEEYLRVIGLDEYL